MPFDARMVLLRLIPTSHFTAPVCRLVQLIRAMRFLQPHGVACFRGRKRSPYTVWCRRVHLNCLTGALATRRHGSRRGEGFTTSPVFEDKTSVEQCGSLGETAARQDIRSYRGEATNSRSVVTPHHSKRPRSSLIIR